LAERKAVVKLLSGQHSIKKLCEVLELSRSACCRQTGIGRRAEINAVLFKEIESIFNEHRQRYGSPRIHIELRRRGIQCGEKRVASLHGSILRKIAIILETRIAIKEKYGIFTNRTVEKGRLKRKRRLEILTLTFPVYRTTNGEYLIHGNLSRIELGILIEYCGEPATGSP
jgi:hypothetical protein